MSKGHNDNILGTVLCVKLKLTRPVLGNVEQIKRQRLHHNTTVSTPPATTATIIVTVTTENATKTTTTAAKANGIKAKNLDNTETVLNKIETFHAHIDCHEDVSEKLLKRLMVLS